LTTLIRLAALLFSLAWTVAWAQPLDVVTERAWLEDSSGQMTLEQVQQSPMQPLGQADFNQGYSASAFWVRVRIDATRLAPDDTDQRLVMRIHSPNLDDVRLYDPLYQGAQAQVGGDLHALPERAYRSLNINFVVPRGGEPRDLWLRIHTTSSTLTKVQVLVESEARRLDGLQIFWSMVYVAALVICLGWAVLAWQLLRDRLILFYVVREFAAIAYAIVVLGGFRLLTWNEMPPVWGDGFSNFIACGLVAVLIWFDIQLLSQYRPHAAALWVLRAGASLCALGALLTIVGLTPLAFQINSVVILFLPIALLWAALSTRAWSDGHDQSRPYIPRWALLGLYSILPLLVLLNRAVLSGWLPPVVIASHVGLAYLLIGSVVMMVLLQLRALRIYRQQQEVSLQLRVAEEHAQKERDRREEQERFVAMLGHELRNPLTAVGLLADEHTEDGQQIRRAVRDMAQILERSLQTGRLSDGRLLPMIGPVDMNELLQEMGNRSQRIDLTNFEPGTHATSDRVYLQIVLGNLVDNALKYSPAESRVRVQGEAIQENGRPILQMTVSNQPGAAGIPDAKSLFQKYYRSPKSHQQIGAGLGLFLTKSLLDMLKGTIEYVQALETEPAQVVFVVRLPVNFEGA
jgi:signal transduction histidine kinase